MAKKVLVVDDNEMNLEVVKGLLKRTKIQVDLAESGQECLEKTREKQYDLILMDIQLPGINGYEATTRIYSLNRKDLRKIPVIAMTANAFEADREKAFLTGMSEHLSKPIDEKTLISTIKKNIIP